MRKELLKTVGEPPTADELRNAKDGILQSIVFQSESKREVLDRTLRYEYYGFPQDYLERFQAGVAAVTADDVLRVAKESGYFEASTLDEVEKFLHAPAEWSAAHGGATAAPQ